MSSILPARLASAVGARALHLGRRGPVRPAACSLVALVPPVALGMACASVQAADEAARPTRFEGAVGLVATWAPEYDGASASRLKLVPAGFVRYGRLSISGAGGFTTRRTDDVDRGVAASLVQRDSLRVNLSLRLASGRSESDSARLAGMGDIDPALRAQLTLRWRPARDWLTTVALSVDALGEGQGWWLQAGVQRNVALGPETALGIGLSTRWDGATYAQRWYGVTPAQAAASGYPVYLPGAGLSELQLGARLRTELGPHWAAFVSGGVSWQLGRARQSPLDRQPVGASLGGGLVWRF